MQLTWLSGLLFADSYLPRGVCLSWQLVPISIEAVADCLIAAAYCGIAGGLIYLGLKRRSLPPSRLWAAFGIAILAGGATHIVTVLTIWRPFEGIESLFKAATAIATLVPLLIVWRLPWKETAVAPADPMHDRLRDALDHVPAGIMLFDRDEKLVFANTAMKQMFEKIGPVFEPGVSAAALFANGAARNVSTASVGREAEWLSDRMAQFREESSVAVVRLANGRWMQRHEHRLSDGGSISVRTDITELKEAEDAIRESENRFRDFAEVASDWFFETDAEHRYTYVSDSRERDTGIPNAFYIGKRRDEHIFQDTDPETERAHRAAIDARLPFRDLVSSRRHANGSLLYVRSSGRPFFAADGTFRGYRGAVKVITGEIMAQQAVDAAHARLFDAIESMPAGIMIFDDQERLVLANAHVRKMFPNAGSVLDKGTPATAQFEWAAAAHLTPASVGRGAEWVGERLAEFRARNTMSIARLSDGRWIQHLERPMSDGGTISVRIDVSEAKRAEAAIRESESRFRDFADMASDWVWEMGPDLRFSYISPRAEAFTGIPAAELLGRRREEGAIVVDDDETRRQLQADVAARRAYSNVTVARVRPDGAISYVRTSARPIYDEAGAFQGYRGIATEVTKEVLGQRREREAHERLVEALEALPAGIMLFDRDETLVAVNSQHRHLPPDYLRRAESGTRWADLLRAADRDAAASLLSPEESAWIGGRRTEFCTHRDDGEIRLADGRWCQLTQRPTANGGTILVRFDVSERKEAEEKLLHLQKADAIGQLTGGMAHDFNNLLGIVSGHLELIGEAVGDEPELAQLVRICIEAADRGADLTHSLLAFARKQPLVPESVDVNSLVRQTVVILTRTLGEQIELELIGAPDLWRCECDAAQLQSAFINLAVNSRDAMPEGGKLTIETANAPLDAAYAALHPDVEPGRYVMLAVSDTGSGMTPQVLARAFDPFFTTKARGGGSGLGLSMVYGFAKQSRGHVKIYSEAGHGTTVKLYLPKSAGAESAAAPAQEMPDIPTGSETILVVEDDQGMRALTVRLLRALGYRAFEAGNAAQALDLLAAERGIALLLTDVMLAGGMNGPRLAELAKRMRAEVKVLYMSGYTENAIMHHGRLDPGVALLQKPFRRRDLAIKVRSVLDS